MRRQNLKRLILLATVLSFVVSGCGRQHAVVDPTDNVLIGDINNNGKANEISDAVMLSNYFVQGEGVLTDDVERQILATDVNRNGIALELSDLQYLILLIVGEASPYDQLQPRDVTYAYAGGYIYAYDEVSAVRVIAPGEVTPELIPQNFSLSYEYRDGATYILAASMDNEPASGEILSFLTDRGGIEVEMAVPTGATTVAKLAAVAETVYLEQNFPNPFQGSTTINFHLPEAANYRLVISDVEGQPVGEYYGYAEAGVVSFEWSGAGHNPGIYFYRLEANGQSYVKKMMLL